MTEILIEKWAGAGLGPAAVDQSRIDAASAALSEPMPVPPDSDDQDAARAYDIALAEWHMGYASIFHDPAVIAKLEQLNAETVSGPRRIVPIATVMEYLRTNNLWPSIVAARVVSPGAAAAVDYNSDSRTHSINLDLPIVQAMLDDLVARNLLTDEQRTTIYRMGNTVVPWWQSAGFSSPIGTGDLESVFVQTGVALV